MRQYAQRKKEVCYYNLKQKLCNTRGQILVINTFQQVNMARLINLL